MTTRIWMRMAMPAELVRWVGRGRLGAPAPRQTDRNVLAPVREQAGGFVVTCACTWERVALGVLGFAAVAALGLALEGFVEAARAW